VRLQLFSGARAVTDNLIPLRDVPKLSWLPLRRGGGRLNLSTLWRWALKGLRAKDGQLVKLRAIRVGETLCTSEQWLREFFDALTAHDPALATEVLPAPTIRTPGQRRRASEKASRQLDKVGI
jgi:hypothetical protein